MPARKPEITGPSSEPKPPVVTTSTVAAPVIRTGVQGIGAGWIVDAIDIWNVANLTDRQQVWLLVGITALLSFVQNMLERQAGRRLIGAERGAVDTAVVIAVAVVLIAVVCLAWALGANVPLDLDL